MKNFDVVVVGAGPAGGQCARLLAKSGFMVLLVEQHTNFEDNNFSSAAVPLETLKRFELSEKVVGSFWQKIEIVTTNVSRAWEDSQVLGAVLNFAKLREFLAQEVVDYGGEVWMGHRYVKSLKQDGQNLVYLKQRGDNITTVSTKFLVDATGYARAVIYEGKHHQPSFLKATGIEYLIEVEAEKYNNYSNSLVFFLGHHWMPKGYSWIFPMESNLLKVGSACFNAPHKIIDKIEPLKYYINLIIQEHIQIQKYKVIDIHGSIIRYSEGLNDIYYRDNILAIGDAVSTVNPLGGEGIRHAMYGAEIAGKYIKNCLSDRQSSFRNYPQEMQKVFASKWNICEQMSKKVYLEYSDARIDKGVAFLQSLTIEDMIAILFYYKFSKLSKGLRVYLLRKISSLWKVTPKFFSK